jgi:hypothetical protein
MGVHDKENHVLLHPEFFNITALQEGHILINAEEQNILKKIKECKVYDNSVASAIVELHQKVMMQIGQIRKISFCSEEKSMYH